MAGPGSGRGYLRDRIESGFRRLLPGWGSARPDRQEHVITLAAAGVRGADIVGRPRAGALLLIAGGRLSLSSSRLGVSGRQTLHRWCEAGDSDTSGGRAGRAAGTSEAELRVGSAEWINYKDE